MHFAVFKAVTMSRSTRERLGDTDTLFTRLLAQPGQDWRCYDVQHGQLPGEPGELAAVVVSGSPSAAYEETAWVRQLLDALRAVHRAGVPILGICFGMHCVTQALGGRVVANPQGWDVGVVEIQPTDAGRRALPDAPWPLRVIESHSDIVAEPPPGSVVLASSARTPVEMFTLGERVLCLQGHPEMDDGIIRELIEKRAARGLLPAERAAEGLASLERAPHRTYLQGCVQSFISEGRVPGLRAGKGKAAPPLPLEPASTP